MRLSPTTVRLGLIIAGAYNVLGVLVFSLGFSNRSLMETDPTLFSAFGLVGIMLWGMAYAATAKAYQQLPALLWVFCLEKILYGSHWLNWLAEHGQTLPTLWAQSPLTGMFYAIYGAGDLGFALFFGVVAWQIKATKN